ncbi:MAG: HAD-IA family hydrolase [Bryobacterales bacterium]|nr:HAD-IA family hydrolase [Bryobacterales bacterium]
MSKVLIFDCDGVLGDTEQFGHLPAFNRMWRELGVPWEWSVEEYGRKLKIGGGKERMLSLFDEPAFLAAYADAPATPEGRKEMVAAWHKKKSGIYKEIIASGKIPPRPGVRRISEEALDAGWTLAVASTSALESVEAVLRHAMGERTAKRFSLVLAGDCVKAKKPAPDIYLLAADRLGANAKQCVVVEDSGNGLDAAVAAGMKCVVTVSGYTREEDFTAAALVVSSLGDPGGEVCQVLANRSAARPASYITVADLDKILATDEQG